MKNHFQTYALLTVSAILYGLGYPTEFSTSLLITPIIALVILLYILTSAPNWKIRFFNFFYFNSAVNLFSFYWITHTLQEFGHLPWPIAFLLNLLFAFIIGPHLWVLLIASWLIDKKTKFSLSRTLSKSSNRFILALIFTFAEFCIPTQFPSNIGAPWISLGPYLGFAQWGGLPLYSLFSYWLVFEFLVYFLKHKFSKLNIAFIAIFIISNPIIAYFNKNHSPKIKNLNIRLVQANISNFLKLESETGSYPSVQQVLERYQTLSTQPYPYGNLDLIIWPETAYPYSIATDKQELAATLLPSIFAEIIYKMNAEMIIGGYDERIKSNGSYFETEYNSAFHINDEVQLQNVYHKHILIPFGETLPLGPFNQYVSPMLQNIAFFSKGTKFPVFKLKNGVKAIGAICYEILEADFIRNYLSESGLNPEVIINLTNDSWYGDTAEPYLHKFMGKWRAVENQVVIIRSTNTGITSVIYPDGTESKNLGIFTEGNLDLSLKIPERKETLFGKWGMWTLVPLAIFYLIFNLILLKLYRDEKA